MPIRTAIKDHIGEIILDHPPVNALGTQGWSELAQIIAEHGRHPEVRV